MSTIGNHSGIITAGITSTAVGAASVWGATQTLAAAKAASYGGDVAGASRVLKGTALGMAGVVAASLVGGYLLDQHHNGPSGLGAIGIGAAGAIGGGIALANATGNRGPWVLGTAGAVALVAGGLGVALSNSSS